MPSSLLTVTYKDIVEAVVWLCSDINNSEDYTQPVVDAAILRTHTVGELLCRAFRAVPATWM